MARVLPIAIAACQVLAPPIAPAAALSPADAAQPGVARGAQNDSARQRLEARRIAELTRPDERVQTAPAPPAFEYALLTLPAFSTAESNEPLEAVLDRFAARDVGPAPVDAPARATGDDLTSAMRLYVRARGRIIEDDAFGAITDLDQAIALDPASPELHLTLAEALLRVGNEARARQMVERAVALGLEHPRPRLLLSVWSLRDGRLDSAVAHAARGVRSIAPGQDPALRHMVWATLADALAAAGYTRASASAYATAFDLPAAFPSGTLFVAELSSMYRGAWDALHKEASQGAATGRWEMVDRTLRAARRFQAFDDGRVLPARVLAAMRLGHPADAALMILDAVEQHGAATDERARRCVEYLRDHTDVAPLLREALADLAALAAGESPTIDASMARLIAACEAPEQARATLREALDAQPFQHRLLRDLIEAYGPGDRAGATRALAAHAGAHPAMTQGVAAKMIEGGLRDAGVLDTLRSLPDEPGAGLLLARLLVESARFDEAEAVLVGVLPGGDAERVATVEFMRVSVAAMRGQPDAARALLDAWPERDDPSDAERCLLVGAFKAIGDQRAALDAALASPTVMLLLQRDAAPDGESGGTDFGSPAPVEDSSCALLFQASQLARELGDNERAGSLARSLVAADPFAESGHTTLVALHTPGAPLADQARLQQALQGLREYVPASTLLRFISARELLQIGRLGEADQRLRGLATDAPWDQEAIDALMEAWSLRATRESPSVLIDAEACLRAHIAANPHLLGPRASLARLLLIQNRSMDAVQAAVEWLALGLIPTGDDRNRLRAIADPLMRRATSPTEGAARDALLALFTAMDGASVDLDPQMHQVRLALLGGTRPIDEAALLRAAASAADQIPALDPGAYLLAAQHAVGTDQPAVAFNILRAAAARPAGLSPQDTSRWAGLIAREGNADNLRDLLGITTAADDLAAILLVMPGGPDEPPSDPARLRADVAYAIAGATRVLDRPTEIAEGFLSLALELFPEHGSAANDLGYEWADRGIRLDEAEHLLEMAIRLRPDEANVLDSLGWLRYKQGRLTDLADEAGEPLEGGRGAVWLLERATSLLDESDGPVTLDQLGDALWRAGRADDALARWREALPRARRTVESYESGGAPAGMLQDARTRVETIEAKIAAAESGQEPEIAPLGEGVAEAR
ncbi:MAG: hypothetical protein KDA05_06005 [Phycisphaerales bacterium]|nr:hypothetical protein [Phycisphaerales bacterium]